MSVQLLIFSAQCSCFGPPDDGSFPYDPYNVELPVDGEWLDICYGNGLYIIIPVSGKVGLQSEDGNHWTEIVVPDSCNSIGYSNGHFLLGKTNGDMCVGIVMKYSKSKAIYWSPPTRIGENQPVVSISNGFGSHMMSITSVDETYGRAYQSTDSIAWFEIWKSMTEMYDNKWNDLTYFKNKYVLSSSSGTLAYTKSNANNTVSIVLNSTDYSYIQPTQILRNDLETELLLVGNSYITLISSDGIKWQNGPEIPIDDAIVAHGDGCYVAMSKNTERSDVYYLYDIWNDKNWSDIDTKCMSKGIAGITYGENKFIAVPKTGKYVTIIPRELLV